jgi:redox-sensitive bicupin YhaK (pirin superfamily)
LEECKKTMLDTHSYRVYAYPVCHDKAEVVEAVALPRSHGYPWHPHRGFETGTYMIDGILRHQDSNGGGGLITDGDTQMMTAGEQ